MNHDSYRDLIQRELDEDLSGKEMELLDRHTLTCAACRSERAEYRQLALGLSTMKPVVPERSFVASMEIDFDELLRPMPSVTPLQKKGRRFPARWWQGLSVAVAVVLAIGFTAQYLPGTSTQSAQPRTQNTTESHPPVVAMGDASEDGTGSAPEPTGSVTGTRATEHAKPGTSESTGTGGGTSVPTEQPKATGSASTASRSGTASAVGSSTAGTAQAAKPLHDRSNAVGSSKAGGSSSTSVAQVGSSSASGTPTESAGGSASSTGAVAHAGGIVVASTGGKSGSASAAGLTKPPDSSSTTVTPVSTPASPPPTAGMVSALQDRGESYGLAAGALSAERPPLPLIVGFVQQKPSILNETLQKQVQAGDDSVRWATVPTQVVQHVLTDIGFAPTAVVAEAPDHPDRVTVTQGGQEFIVKLVQPFDTGKNGIWQPVQISRTLPVDSQESTDKPILAYFKTLEQNNPVTFSNMQVEESLFMGRTVVGVDMTSKTPFGIVENRLSFSFHLRLNGDYTWSIDGTPSIRKN